MHLKDLLKMGDRNLHEGHRSRQQEFKHPTEASHWGKKVVSNYSQMAQRFKWKEFSFSVNF